MPYLSPFAFHTIRPIRLTSIILGDLAHFFSPIFVIQVILLSLVQPTALVFLQVSIIFHLFCKQLCKATHLTVKVPT